ncbi:MAG: diguanylate cyclase [Chloroflexi bacterium]|nr:diguanylate cyclase [Chloroflexota bacterium]
MPGNIDRLTRLRTEDFLDESLPFEIERCERYGRPVSFLLVEPRIDDRESTDVLYPILKKIAAYIRNHTRFMDISVRIGRQVLLVMTETSLESAAVVEKKIKNIVESEPYEVSPSFPHINVQLRTALGAYPEAGREATTILKTLRDRLYGFDKSPGEEPWKESSPGSCEEPSAD